MDVDKQQEANGYEDDTDQISSHDQSESLSRAVSEAPMSYYQPHVVQHDSSERTEYSIEGAMNMHADAYGGGNFVDVKAEAYNGDVLGNGSLQGHDVDNGHHETYKQAWSVSEQHLLEKLLEEYPDGVKNRFGISFLPNSEFTQVLSRWSKISKAMGGRRTPRQVASRVQKYFAKLKKFGIDVPGK